MKIFRDRWFARKNGILTQINEVWLKSARKEEKSEVGRLVNGIKGEIERKVEKGITFYLGRFRTLDSAELF